MKLGVQAALVAASLVGSPAHAQSCQTLRLTVSPPEKAAQVAATLKRRLETAGQQASVEAEGAELRVALPAGVAETLLTRPARVEFRLVATSDDAPGALSLPRAAGGRESVDPQIILDESHLRDFKLKDDAGRTAIDFRFDPHAIKNLMSATADGLGRKLAIIVDDVVVADPLIRAPVASMEGEIDAGLTRASAQELVDLLRDGRLTASVGVAARGPCKTP